MKRREQRSVIEGHMIDHMFRHGQKDEEGRRISEDFSF